MAQLLLAQNARQKGDQAWAIGKYKTAINNYSLVKNIAEDKELLAKRGLGYFKLNQLARAINDFTLSKKLGNENPELYFLMAQSKHHLNEYEEAAYFYKQYVKEAGEKNSETELAIREVKNCAYAAFHRKEKSTAFVESFGPEINTYYDEIYTLQSPTFGNSFYFSSNRNLADNDVFAFSLDEKGNWMQEKSVIKGINSKADEYVMDISADGKSMLFNRTAGLKINHHIYVSTWDEKDKQHIIELPEYLLEGAVDLQFVDRNTIAFASKDLGGLGGYDIFIINYKNGVWSDPIHQGDIINSEYDDRSPYFSSTMEYIYFSTNRPYCYGGFDVYYYNLLGINETPTNMGAPINSSGNDLHYRLSQDGQMAVMSSDRKTGEGAYDIYQVYMQDFKPMPAKDTAQLEYVQDYLNYLKPKVPKKPKTHLDKLKEKLGTEEAAADKETEADKKAADIAIAETKEKEELAAKAEAKRTAELAAAEKKRLEAEKAALAEAEEQKLETERKQKLADKKAAEKAALVAAANESKRLENEQKEAEKKAAKEKENASLAAQEKSKAEKRAREEADKLEAEKAALAKTKEESQNKESQYKESQNKESERLDINRVVISNLPQKESGESPLADIEKADVNEAVIAVQFISGEQLDNSFLYQDRHDLMNEVNKQKLDKLVSYLKSNADHKVHLIAHTDHLELGLEEYMQYNTLKRANLIARYILEQNISKDRISIESVMSNYPIAKEQVGGLTNEKYLAYNKRVDFEIRDAGNFVLSSMDFAKMKIPGYAQDRRYELFSQIREEVYYSVQIASTKHIFKNAVLRIYDDIYIRKETPLANNKYYIGIYNKFEDAVILQKNLAESSAPYAKIVAFYNGQPIKKSDLEVLAKDYPDLKNYLSTNKG